MDDFVYDLEINQGADTEIRLVWIGDDGIPHDLTGYEARMKVRRTVLDTETVFALTSETDEGIVLGGEAGTIDVTFSATDTAAVVLTEADLSLSNFRTAFPYDIELVDGDDKVTRLVSGKLKMKAEVTR